MKGFLTRRWELILPGCGGTAALARGAILAARLLQIPSQLAIGQWDWGLNTLRGSIDPGYFSLRLRVVGGVEIWKNFLPGDGK